MSTWVHIYWFLRLRKRRTPTLLWKTGNWPIPCFQKQGNGFMLCHFPVFKNRELDLCYVNSLFLKAGNWHNINPIPCFWTIGIQDISVLFFALIQCYWLEDGSEVLENSLLIPRWKKIWIPHSRLRRSWGIHFFSPRDSEGILQSLLAILKPLSHCYAGEILQPLRYSQSCF